MEPNPYKAPAEHRATPHVWSIWPRTLVYGVFLTAAGILMVLGAHILAPRRYAFLSIALAEKIVWLGLLVAAIGVIGWAIKRLLMK